MKFVRKATGKEVIPHVNFWLSIPGNVKVKYLTFGMLVRSSSFLSNIYIDVNL